MISQYLAQLFLNCKALKPNHNLNELHLIQHFDQFIQALIIQRGLSSEKELLELFIKTDYKSLGFENLHPLLQIFYLVNSFSEYNSQYSHLDELGRYTYSNSLQIKTGITKNTALELILDLVKKDPFLNQNFTVESHKSYFFLSHDIDSLYGSTLQDGLWALKHFRFDVMLKIIANLMLSRPHWFNIDVILKMESEYDFRSTFYWLVNQGKIDQRQSNSDYNIKSNALKSTLQSITQRGFENGLHKSISKEDFKEELNKLPEPVIGNRYHYLKFQLPVAYQQIENSGLQLDASLGFAEHYGFRNNYGYPFSPFNVKTNSAHRFLEVPLNIMDGTFHRYLKVPVEQTSQSVINFLEANKNNCLLSILWHNTFFTDYKYKGYKEEYKKILGYLYEQKFVNINQTELIRLFSWKK